MTYEMPMKHNAQNRTTSNANAERAQANRAPSVRQMPSVGYSRGGAHANQRTLRGVKTGYQAPGALIAIGNAAVSFAKETKNALAEVHPEPKIKTVNDKNKKQFPFSFVFSAVITTFLIMFIIMNYVMIHDYTREISELNEQIGVLMQNEKDLSLELTKKEDILTIEKIAREELGMVQGDQVTRKYISLESGDKTEVLGDQSNDRNYPLFTAMSAIGNAIVETVSYMK